MKFADFFTRERFLIICWMLYDLSNQFFVLPVISLYFPRWLMGTKNVPEIFYSLAFGISMILVAFCAPVMGTISDQQRKKKPYLIAFTLIAVGFTFLIGLTEKPAVALVCFAAANFGCQMAVIFYNALIVKIARPEQIGLVSGLGRMCAYIGAILVLVLTKPVVAAYGYHPVFLLTAGLFLLFALPAMIFIPEKKFEHARPLRSYLAWRELKPVIQKILSAFQKGSGQQEIRLFLYMFFFGMCAVQTIFLFMAVYAGKVFGLSEAGLSDLITVATVFAIVSSLVSGYLGDRVGSKPMMIGIFILWIAGILVGALGAPPFHWLIGIMMGTAIGATWVVGRAWAVHLAPEENIAEIFGLYNLAGYAAGLTGPLFWGTVLFLFSDVGNMGVWGYRLSLLSLLIFIALAFICLMKIPPGKHTSP